MIFPTRPFSETRFRKGARFFVGAPPKNLRLQIPARINILARKKIGELPRRIFSRSAAGFSPNRRDKEVKVC